MSEQFEFVKALKTGGAKTAVVLRNKLSGIEVVKLSFEGDPSVYEALKNISHPNLPRVYGVERSGKSCLP